jgi:hypothetical protein
MMLLIRTEGERGEKREEERASWLSKKGGDGLLNQPQLSEILLRGNPAYIM